jgi:hypothetical protein
LRLPVSLDLLSPDFCLFGFLKKNVYKNNSHTLEKLKQNIDVCILNITAEAVYQVA